MTLWVQNEYIVCSANFLSMLYVELNLSNLCWYESNKIAIFKAGSKNAQKVAGRKGGNF